jgi:hypothetical protein
MPAFKVKLQDIKTHDKQVINIYADTTRAAQVGAIKIARKILGADATFDILETTNESLVRFKQGDWPVDNTPT